MGDGLPDRTDEDLNRIQGLGLAQDQTTWLVLSILVAANAVLIAEAVSHLLAQPPIQTLALSLIGLTLTVVAWEIVSRSNRYMRAYFRILGGDLPPADPSPDSRPLRDYYDSQFLTRLGVPERPSARTLIGLMMTLFTVAWFLLLAYAICRLLS